MCPCVRFMVNLPYVKLLHVLRFNNRYPTWSQVVSVRKNFQSNKDIRQVFKLVQGQVQGQMPRVQHI